MLFDCHIHSSASPDGRMSPEEAIAITEKLGIGCVFTEHIDYGPQGEMFFCADLEVYPRDYLQYKSDRIGLGLEIGLRAECVELNQAIAGNPGLDYIAGSIHVTNGIDIGYDPDSFFKGGMETYAQHLDYTREMIEANEFIDALAHIDYISRYSPFPEKDLFYDKYADSYDALLRALVERGKLLELSTRRLRDKLARDNLFAIFSRYRDLGGRYVVIGSDAHTTGQLGYKFGTALEMLNEIGLVPAYFNKRRMILC